MTRTDRAIDLFSYISKELGRAYAKHGAELWGRHEFYGVLKEEFKELEDAIFNDHTMERVLEEAAQVAAVVFRYYESGDRYRGDHPSLTQGT